MTTCHRNGWFAAACLLAGLWGGGASAAELTAEDAATIQQAQSALSAGQFEQVVTLLTPLRGNYPDLGDIPRLLGHAYFEQKQLPEARKAALEAIGLGRTTPDVLACVARIDRERDDKVALLGAVRLLTVLDPDNRDWRMIYGDLLADAGTLDEAAATYGALFAGAPDDSKLALRLGNVRLQQKRLPEAAAMFETAWRLGATDARLPRSLSGIWHELGDNRQALAWTERAIEVADEKDPRLTLQLAGLLFKLQEYDRTVAAAELLADVDDKDLRAQASLILGQVAIERNQPDEAIRHWRAAVDAGHTARDLLVTIGAHYFNRRQYEPAAKFLAQVVDADQADDEQTLRFLILSLIQCKQRDRCEVYLRKYLERNGLSDEAKSLIRAWAG